MSYKIGVLGCGNMASAVVEAIYETKKGVEFFTFTPSQTRAIELAKKVCGHVIQTFEDLKKMDYIIVACKPQQFLDLAKDLASIDFTNQVFVSIMAAISVKDIENLLGTKHVIRYIPSLPIKELKGINLLYKSIDCSEGNIYKFKELLELTGETIITNTEDEFNRLTILSSCGPAFVYLFAQSLFETFTDWDFDQNMVRKVLNKLFEGASSSMSRNNTPLQEQIDQVTSKKGVTIEGIETFKEMGIMNITKESVMNAYKRSREIEQMIQSLK